MTVCFVYLARQFGQLLVSPFSQSSFSFVKVVYIVTVILTAVLCCLCRDPARGPSFRVQERRGERREERREKREEKIILFVGSNLFGRKCKIHDCTQICSSEQVFGEMETRSEFSIAPEHCKIFNAAGFSVELERLDDGESPRMNGANVIGVKKPPWMEMDQW